ncbi:MAG: MATE family efflux transporter [Caldilineaceae bacterium]
MAAATEVEEKAANKAGRLGKVERLGTEGIGKLLAEMSAQTTFSLLVYAIYSITDTYFLSVGVNSLAAAGASIISPVLIALGGVATIVGVGGASVVSRALGGENVPRASRTVANTFLIFWTIALAITIAGTLLIEPLVYLFGATDSIAPYAIEYGRIILLGAITATGFSAIVRADGSVNFSTAMWVIPVTTNIVLCWLFIMVLHMGAGGAALATVLGQSVSAGMSIYFFFFRKVRPYRIKAAYFKPDWPIMGEVLMIGLPSFLKSISASLVVIITNNLLKVLGGDSALGVFAIVSRLYAAIGIPQTGIVQAMQPLVGFNFGQKRFARVKRTITLSLRATVGYGVVVCAICLLIPGILIGMLSHEPAIILEGQKALRMLSLAYPLSGVAVMVAAYFQSLGKAKDALLLTLGGMLLVKLPVLLLGARLFGLDGIWASEAVSELILCAVALLMLRYTQARAAWVPASTAP